VNVQPYRDEFAQVKRSLNSTCKELAGELRSRGREIDAMRVEEATAFITASFHSLNRTLALVEPGVPTHARP